MRRGWATGPDAALLDRAARRLGLQAAALVAGGIILVALVLGVLVLHGQRSDDESLIHHAAVTADDVDDPPAGMWLVLAQGAGVDRTPGLPSGLPYAPDLAAVRAGSGAIERRLTVGGRHVEVLTQTRPDGAVQAVLDLHPQDRLETHLVEALVAFALLALVTAAGIGSLLARRAVRPLAGALRLQRAFVADASHELRTPLTLLSTRAQLLRDGVADVARDRQVLQDADGVVRDVARLSEVVDDLLLAADPRVRDGDRSVDLVGLCHEVLDGAEPYASTQSVSLTLRAPGPCTVRGSGTALRRAVLALVDNAVRHTPAGGEVTVEVTREGRSASVTVTDTGPGLDPADAERLFARFASGVADPTGPRRRFGLGLSLVRDIAARHGGDLRVLPSAPGRGARLRLDLPDRGRGSRLFSRGR